MKRIWQNDKKLKSTAYEIQSSVARKKKLVRNMERIMAMVAGPLISQVTVIPIQAIEEGHVLGGKVEIDR